MRGKRCCRRLTGKAQLCQGRGGQLAGQPPVQLVVRQQQVLQRRQLLQHCSRGPAPGGGGGGMGGQDQTLQGCRLAL
jgi:hypothetical protein